MLLLEMTIDKIKVAIFADSGKNIINKEEQLMRKTFQPGRFKAKSL